ncbi:hypothetical protein [Tatumella punctata]|uniref:Uncharacterized protein n=1 Tax=Tatumella punctata TaxID=399969 RepID=A0ABW1VV10_9GAMM
MDRQYNNGLTAEQRLSATVQSPFTAEPPAAITEAARVLIAGPQAYCCPHAVKTVYPAGNCPDNGDKFISPLCNRPRIVGRRRASIPENCLPPCKVA